MRKRSFQVRLKYARQYTFFVFIGTALGVVVAECIKHWFSFWIEYGKNYVVTLEAPEYRQITTKILSISIPYVITILCIEWFVSKMTYAYDLLQKLTREKIDIGMTFVHRSEYLNIPYNELADIIWAIFYSFSEELLPPLLSLLPGYIVYACFTGTCGYYALLPAALVVVGVEGHLGKLHQVLFSTWENANLIKYAALIDRVLAEKEKQKYLQEQQEQTALQEEHLDVE